MPIPSAGRGTRTGSAAASHVAACPLRGAQARLSAPPVFSTSVRHGFSLNSLRLPAAQAHPRPPTVDPIAMTTPPSSSSISDLLHWRERLQRRSHGPTIARSRLQRRHAEQSKNGGHQHGDNSSLHLSAPLFLSSSQDELGRGCSVSLQDHPFSLCNPAYLPGSLG